MSSRKRCRNFTSSEIDLLIDLMTEPVIEVIENKMIDSATLVCKNETWAKLTERFYASGGGTDRDTKSLKSCWKRLKEFAKKEKIQEERQLSDPTDGEMTYTMTGNNVFAMEVDDVELYERVLEGLREKELQLPRFNKRSPHFMNGDRRVIVDWIILVCGEFRLALLAQHLAVALFDFFIDCHQADSQGLYLVAAACISIACKIEDIEMNIPPASKLLHQIPLKRTCGLKRLRVAEVFVLQHFDWMVHIPTEAHFVDYYSSACLAGELEFHSDEEYKAKLTRYFHKWINYFREKTLHIVNLRYHRPSIVACSIVQATRQSLVMKPDWPGYMVEITGTKQNDTSQPVRLLMSSLDDDIQAEKQLKAQLSTSSAPAIRVNLAFTPSPINSSGSSQATTPAGERWSLRSSGIPASVSSTPDEMAIGPTYFRHGSIVNRNQPCYHAPNSVPHLWPAVTGGDSATPSIQNPQLLNGNHALVPFVPAAHPRGEMLMH